MPDFIEPASGCGLDRTTKHDETVYFGIDTFCVPQESYHLTFMREQGRKFRKAGVRFDTVSRVTQEGFYVKIPAFSAFTISSPSQLQAPFFPVGLNGLKNFVRSSPIKDSPT